MDRGLEDPRLDQIIDLIGEFGLGNFNARLETSQKHDDVDAIITGLVILGEELGASLQALKRLPGQLVEAQEAERRRIAEELHDEIGQPLIAIKLTLGTLLRSKEGAQRADLGRIDVKLSDLIDKVSQKSMDLRPSMLDDFGLSSTVAWLAGVHTGQTGIHFRLSQDELRGRRLHPEIETVVFRVVEEGMTNIAQHSNAKDARVELLVRGDSLLVTITDEGVGFDPQTKGNADTIGLKIMRERVNRVGGELNIEAAPDHGTKLSVEIPLEPV